jgi:hypothetical protein
MRECAESCFKQNMDERCQAVVEQLAKIKKKRENMLHCFTFTFLALLTRLLPIGSPCYRAHKRTANQQELQ